MTMAHVASYSPPSNWNRLGLRGYSSVGRPSLDPPPAWLCRPARAPSPTSWTTPETSELSDEELLELAEREGHFSFLEDPCEDVYTWEDGEEA